ncbi:ficolin-1-like [Eriocheir sinensis]|uniref:ficolin-1-like n=1 Tax=Eriocheir sinensis TaxID=95602 RepID=UPI0021C87FA6|nr:ficolin-1-like [Eriocheir sinensis]
MSNERNRDWKVEGITPSFTYFSLPFCLPPSSHPCSTFIFSLPLLTTFSLFLIGGGRRRVTAAEVREVVNAALEEQLQPLHTALGLIRLDTFTEHVHRQLSTLEHIQGKLLTEYGELKAAVGEVGKNTVELMKQMAALDARVTALDRSSPQRHPQETIMSRLDSEDYPQAPVSSEVTQVTRVVREAVASISDRLQATERRFKEDLATLENRTTQAMRKTHVDLDRRLATAGHDSILILNTLDQLANNTCPGDRRGGLGGPERRGISPSLSRSRQQRTYLTGAKERSAQDDLAYFPTENGVEKEAPGARSDGRRRGDVDESGSWQMRGVQGRPITEVQSLNLGMVTRLASEIARQMTEEDAVSTQPRDCAAVAAAGETTSGVYTIYPASCTARFSVQVWCELEEGGPSWTVIQRRGSKTSETPHPVVDFFRSWAEYKWGFGNLEGEYWLGLEYIHQLTQSGDYELRVDLQDWANETRWAKYEHFSLSHEDHNYTLSLGDYEGTAGNSLRYHQGAPFSTRDRDNDFNPRGHCARTFHGAWWFTACHESHLNGRYHHGRHKSYGDGINWMAFRGHNYSLKYSRMMIRRTNI